MKKLLLINVFLLAFFGSGFAQNKNSAVYRSKAQFLEATKKVTPASVNVSRTSTTTTTATETPEFVVDKKTNRKVLVAKPKPAAAKIKLAETIND